MQSSTLNKITIGTLGVLLAGSVGYGVHQSDQVRAWQTEATGWQSIAHQTNGVSLKVNAQNSKLVHKYNQLVRTSATNAANAAITVSAAAPVQAAPVVQAAPASAPATKAS